MPRCKPVSQLDRIERQLGHIHEMQHFIFEAVHELLVSGQDMARLSEKAVEMKGKTDALRVAIASVNKTPPAGDM